MFVFIYPYRIGRLLFEMIKIDDEVTCFKDIINVSRFQALEKALNALMHVSLEPAPSPGIKLGISLSKVTNLIKSGSDNEQRRKLSYRV